MPINSYIENIAKRYALGNATEHTFRGDLQRLIEELVPEVAATNEPKRIECGAPDYVITRKDIPVGYIEAKDVGVDLDGKNLKEQFDRYRNALDNLVFTDYLDFRFYLNGEAVASVRIAEIRNGKVAALPELFDQFTSLVKEFASRTPQTIKSSKRLAEMMAEKAKILAFIIKNALEEDIAAGVQSDLTDQMKAFRDILIHDIDAKSFADIYAQTIAYGMFAARLHDPTLPTFSRQEAAGLIPKTNPFLRKLFQFIAAFDLDNRIDWIVDALADLFRAADIAAILRNFGKSTQTHDPIMHFYETFLAEYDPKLRKSRGVFYTPEPVVDFIVRAVDDILKTEFGLSQGLADTSKTKIKVKTTVKKKDGTYLDEEKEVHKVQILDPATGTGTFLASVIKHIYKGFENQEGIWSQYVDQHLIPRLNGFEILMASYAMAHLKLDLLLGETGYKDNKDKRFQVYLTNALEEYHPDTGTLFASWLSTEANEANHIKRDTPVMVVIGNPPYSGVSSNMGKWISDLIEQYKYVDGEHFGERKHWLHDDYVKFIRFGQNLVEKNGEGVLAFINNHSFLDNPTFKGMRWNLLKCFDSIHVLDLQGSSKKIEMIPDGVTSDENVFDIQQGVSINIFVKKSVNNSGLAKVRYATIWGTRGDKYKKLENGNLESIEWAKVSTNEPNYFFVPQNYKVASDYDGGFNVNELFSSFTMGFASAQDKLTVDFDSETLWKTVSDFKNLDEMEIRVKYSLTSDSRDWTVPTAKQDIISNFGKDFIKKTSYRPFDERFTYYTGNSRGFYASPQRKVMSHLGRPDNFAFCTCRMNRDLSHTYFISRNIVSKSVISSLDNNYVFPLYLYPEHNPQPTLDGRTERVPNLNSEIVDKIAAAIGLKFTNEKEETDGTCAPIDILDYIYAVLHSPSYRETYKEFLKIDFPRVPYPKDATMFWQLVRLGGELRQIHLLESPKVTQFITGFPVGGDNIVEKIAFVSEPPALAGGQNDGSGESNWPPAHAGGSDLGRVYFSDTQYFSGVPATAWNFYIGGYQPAQKWLKDRKGRKLSFDDIQHYQKIIVALTETDRIMKEIDKIAIVDQNRSTRNL